MKETSWSGSALSQSISIRQEAIQCSCPDLGIGFTNDSADESESVKTTISWEFRTVVAEWIPVRNARSSASLARDFLHRITVDLTQQPPE
jgi:hypothetical protein